MIIRKSRIELVRSLLCLLCAVSLFSCGSTVNDQLSTQDVLTENDLLESKQRRNRYSDRIFTYWETESNDVSYYIEQGSISTRQHALAVIQTMEAEVSALKSLISQYSSGSLNIWIVEQDFVFGRELMDTYINRNGQIVTSPELMQNGDYLNAVARVLLESSSPLLSYGLAEYIHPSPLAEDLSVYYSQDDNKTVLDLLPIRFLKSIAGNEADTARQTAGELLEHTIQSYGFKEALAMLSMHTSDLTELKQEWLISIGVENYQYSSCAEGLWEQFDVSPAEDGYDLLVTTNSADYHFKFVKQNVRSIQTPVPIYLINAENVIRFLIDNERGLQELKSLIQSSAYASSFHLADKLDYFIDESQAMHMVSSYGSYTDSYSFDKPAIFLSLPVEIAHIHEAFHAMESGTLLSEMDRYGNTKDWEMKRWVMEGAAYYATNAISPELTQFISYPVDGSMQYNPESLKSESKKINYLARRFNSLYRVANGEGSEDLDSFSEILIARYLEWGGKATDAELFNRRYAIDAYAAASLANDPDAKDVAAYAFYFESWASFLVDTYSFDHLLGVLVGESSFDEGFGMSFDDTLMEWKAYLSR